MNTCNPIIAGLAPVILGLEVAIGVVVSGLAGVGVMALALRLLLGPVQTLDDVDGD